MQLVTSQQVQEVITHSCPGSNTRFLKAAHSFWTRFHNYESSPPLAYVQHDQIVSLLFATFNRNRYTNAYEIVTIQGQEGHGYASRLWDEYIAFAVEEKHSMRLKLSCTPASVTWHLRNGLVFWGVDPKGSLRSDQQLFPTRTEQLHYQSFAMEHPEQVCPPPLAMKTLLRETLDHYPLSGPQRRRTLGAIHAAGSCWLRESMLVHQNMLETFLQ